MKFNIIKIEAEIYDKVNKRNSYFKNWYYL